MGKIKGEVMNKIFIACPISKYIEENRFISDNLRAFIEELYQICQKYASEVFITLRREEYDKKIMTDIHTMLDFEEMKTTDLVVAIPEDSKEVAVELGWASYMKKHILLLLDCNDRYTPLITGLKDITDTEIIWYNGKLSKDILSCVDSKIQDKSKE